MAWSRTQGSSGAAVARAAIVGLVVVPEEDQVDRGERLAHRPLRAASGASSRAGRAARRARCALEPAYASRRTRRPAAAAARSPRLGWFSGAVAAGRGQQELGRGFAVEVADQRLVARARPPRTGRSLSSAYARLRRAASASTPASESCQVAAVLGDRGLEVAAPVGGVAGQPMRVDAARRARRTARPTSLRHARGSAGSRPASRARWPRPACRPPAPPAAARASAGEERRSPPTTTRPRAHPSTIRP